jgi:hypothetical protein
MFDARAHMVHDACMTSTATTPAPDSVPARPGTLGLNEPKSPLAFIVSELERVSGHELELITSGEGYALFDWTVGDAMSEGPTRAECVANAFDAYWPAGLDMMAVGQ